MSHGPLSAETSNTQYALLSPLSTLQTIRPQSPGPLRGLPLLLSLKMTGSGMHLGRVQMQHDYSFTDVFMRRCLRNNQSCCSPGQALAQQINTGLPFAAIPRGEGYQAFTSTVTVRYSQYRPRRQSAPQHIATRSLKCSSAYTFPAA